MSSQPSFDEIAHARAGDPETSFIAAESVDVKANRRLVVLALHSLLQSSGEPQIAPDISKKAEELGNAEHPNKKIRYGDSTMRSRLPELKRKGYVEVVDRDGRVKDSSRPFSRYRLTQQGVRLAEQLRRKDME
ncbi:hypothetical protein [Bifidobacterium eulemuris]|uniref:Uncharacterized protein n=1 Tax=Bifidobacterium eulemuris TaxID=1765219 RepID=A0A261G9W2_9BIFI|nr:hypothetical protein [Bifidobacterium eulemuris]OZG68209.1 hypothetical protein BEUL_1222 [Bifidobacterium eulemuris]QOL31734.1 hypothetical protein BE0216_04080 [Bifidobacterium eulemuris]